MTEPYPHPYPHPAPSAVGKQQRIERCAITRAERGYDVDKVTVQRVPDLCSRVHSTKIDAGGHGTGFPDDQTAPRYSSREEVCRL